MLKSISAQIIRSQKNADIEKTNDDGESSSSESVSESSVGVYQWDVNRRDQGLLKINDKSFAVLCSEDDRSNLDNNIKKMPTNRQAVTICLLNCRYDVIPRVAKQLGYKIIRPNNLNSVFNKTSVYEFNYENKYANQPRQVRQEHDMWNLCWTDSVVSVEFCRDMRRFQKINHFPGMAEICRKDLLARNLNRMLKIFPNDYNIFPKTWCFPADLGDAIQYGRMYRNKTYILKPDQGSQGRGIWLTKHLRDVKTADRMICQVYITKPLLIDGYKFDLRVYTLITSIDPLRVYVYNDGLARFATSKYREPSEYNTANIYMHLTNYSVNKHSRTYSTDDEIGTKRKISTLNRILASEGYDVAELWTNIDDVIVKTILCALPMLKHSYNASFPSHDMVQACFELLGMDIIIDSKMKPYILEVNHSPSFHTSEQVDKEVKEALIRDTLVMLNLSADTRKKVLEEDRKRIRDRLLARIKDQQKEKEMKEKENKDINNNDVPSPDSDIYLDKMNNWSQQLKWEDTHLGGFRRVMPCPNDKNKYQKFFVQQNQLSVYCDTAASKRREECAKQQREMLEEKYKANKSLIQSFKKQHLLSGEDEVIKKKKVKKSKSRNFFKADEIYENDERDRCTSMAQREYLVKTCGLLQTIYVNFHRNQLLTDSDKRKYKELFSKLISSLEPNSLPQLSAISKPKVKISNSLNLNNSNNLNFGSSSNDNINNINNNSQSNNSQNNENNNVTTTIATTTAAAATTATNSLAREGSSLSNNQWGVSCAEVPITFKPQLPLLPHSRGQTKANIVRQVTNVIKRHNYETRQQIFTDKII